jgi:hypothetical protein
MESPFSEPEDPGKTTLELLEQLRQHSELLQAVQVSSPTGRVNQKNCGRNFHLNLYVKLSLFTRPGNARKSGCQKLINSGSHAQAWSRPQRGWWQHTKPNDSKDTKKLPISVVALAWIQLLFQKKHMF